MIASTLSRIKQAVNSWQTRPSVGHGLRRRFNNRIPVGSTGLVALTAEAPVDDRTVAEMYLGFYEGAEASFVQRYLPNHLPVIEGGTSLGIVTSLIAQKLQPDVSFITIEANAALIPFASQNVRTNAPDKRVNFLHGALDPSHDGSFTQLALGPLQCSHLGEGITVPRSSLKEIIHAHGIGKFSLVCDIEGAEDLILRYEANSLDHCQFIVIEVHPFEIQVIEDYIHRFSVLGFRLLDRSGRNKRGQVLCFSR